MAVKIFLCSAPEDAEFLTQFKGHLKTLQRHPYIKELSCDQDFPAGTNLLDAIKQGIECAQIILLLVSPHFFNSVSYELEITLAMKRHGCGAAHVIPVLLDHVYWQEEPFGKLQPLPRSARPIVSWPERNEAYLSVIKELRTLLDQDPQQSTISLEEQKRAEREARLRAMLADHSGFFRDRLESFVGRQTELEDLHQCIAQTMLTGGYITITGQAGQGKSSIIAKLVAEYGIE